MSHTEQFQHLKIQLDAIKSATNNFSDENCIGKGGFGKVFKGKVVHYKGTSVVALKRLNRAFGQGDYEFWKEIMTLSVYNHKNIVSLLGYCDDYGEKILVYEYASKKSLDSYLASNDLTWVQRLKICIGAARGLAYLHAPAETQLRIFHRDIKSSNILLDSNWNAKISDFGLSKFAPSNNQFTFMVSNPVGTLGYIDPLYHETGLLTKESDVYSFGVVLFEVLCGRLCFGNKDLRPLVGLVREYYEKNNISELVYSNIKNQIKESSLKLFVDTSYQCLSRDRKERPSMIQIVSALESSLDLQEKSEAKAAVDGGGVLIVNVLRTSTDSRSKYPHDASNYYFLLATEYKGRLVKAEWNQESTLHVKDVDRQSLDIFVYEIVSVKKHRFVGVARLKLRDLTPEMPLTCNLRPTNFGDLKVEVLYKPISDINDVIISSVQKAPIGTPKGGGLLVVIIHAARLHHETFSPSSSVSLLFRGKLRKTVSITNTWDPEWVQEFSYMLEQPPTKENLHLEVTNNSWMGQLIPRMGSIGRVDINLADVVNKKWTYEIYKLQPGLESNRFNIIQVELQWRTSG